LIDGSDFREWFANFFFCHVTEPFASMIVESFR
jgi:hypothetical protein